MESLEKERLEFNCELYQSVVAKHKELFKDVKPEETTGSQDDSLCILDDIEEIDIKPPRVPRHRFRQNQNLIEMESASTSKLKIPSLMDSSLATKPTRDQDMVTVQCIYLQPLNDYFKVKGMRDFAGKEGELSFSEGEILFIADASRPLWWQAENRFKERGLVPSQFVQHVPANVQVIQAQPSADGKKLPPGCKKPSLTQLDKIWFHLTQGLCTPMMRYQTILDEKPASAKHYQAKIFRSVLGVRILVTAQLSRKARRNESESMPIILDEEFPREVAAVIAATDLWAADQKVTK
ncbi:uncharacterized protein LOC132203877 [Neocloeon triangulifer]|uniref:uncharacterized protein LOC132203877 n=1 Tax=Neocloeon triangulifer TaxID=2078957 RepID=UPI00286F1086|nr:uncharacterized protein LOC132203877 [Neocloeon triangulifer]